jgi:hypothetical protein
MVAQTIVSNANGVESKAKLNGKAIKSKNQLRRLKAKEKKVARAATSVSQLVGFFNTLLICYQYALLGKRCF